MCPAGTKDIEDFIRDGRIIERLDGPQSRLIMIIGGADTGKSTLAASLALFLSRRWPTALVDLDMGQSRIGPPTTVGWSVVEPSVNDLSDLYPEDIYFTGSLSPIGHLLPALTGARLMVERALAECKKVVVDTTGLVAEPAGRVLKHFKFDILAPDTVIALERDGELSHIIDPLCCISKPEVVRKAVPPFVGLKDRARRINYRTERFRRYFSDTGMLELSVDDVGVMYAREKADLLSAGLCNRIVSLRDEKNRDRFLGIIKGVDAVKRSIRIETPAQKGFRVSAIVLGSVNVEL